MAEITISITSKESIGDENGVGIGFVTMDDSINVVKNRLFMNEIIESETTYINVSLINISLKKNKVLENTKFINCWLFNINLEEATLNNVHFINCTITNLKAMSAQFNNCSFIYDNSILFQDDHEHTRVHNFELIGATLNNCNFYRVLCHNINFTNAKIIDFEQNYIGFFNAKYINTSVEIKESLPTIRNENGYVKFDNTLFNYNNAKPINKTKPNLKLVK